MELEIEKKQLEYIKESLKKENHLKYEAMVESHRRENIVYYDLVEFRFRNVEPQIDPLTMEVRDEDVVLHFPVPILLRLKEGLYFLEKKVKYGSRVRDDHFFGDSFFKENPFIETPEQTAYNEKKNTLKAHVTSILDGEAPNELANSFFQWNLDAFFPRKENSLPVGETAAYYLVSAEYIESVYLKFHVEGIAKPTIPRDNFNWEE